MTKKKNVTGYLAIEDNGVEIWPKALVEQVYVGCSKEMQRLKKVGTEKVVKMIPICEHCRIRELSCKPKAGVRTDQISCSNCSSRNPCSRPADYMWKTLGATWTKEYAVTLNQFRVWYPKVMAPQSIYVIKDSRGGAKSEVTTAKGGKTAKKESQESGESLDSTESKEDKEGDGDGDNDNDDEEDDEQGDNQDPSPSTSRKRGQGSLFTASMRDVFAFQTPSESSTHDLHLKAEDTRLKELESVKSENERLRTRLLEFETIVGEFMEDAREKQMRALNMDRLREGSAALYSVLDLTHAQNEEFRQHFKRLLDDSLLLRFRLDIDGHPESRLDKDIHDKLHEMAAGMLNLPGPVWTTAEKERIEKIFNPAEGSSGIKRPGGHLEEEAESRIKRARMLLKGKSVGRLGSEST